VLQINLTKKIIIFIVRKFNYDYLLKINIILHNNDIINNVMKRYGFKVRRREIIVIPIA